MAAIHTQVKTEQGVLVDEGMAPLLEAVWRLGLETQFSCECQIDQCPVDSATGQAEGRASIVFSYLEDAFRFLEELVVQLHTYLPYPQYNMTSIALIPMNIIDANPVADRPRAVIDFPAADLGLFTTLMRHAAGLEAALAPERGGQSEGCEVSVSG